MPKVILLNGPRGVGKDTIAEAYVKVRKCEGVQVMICKMMWPMKAAALAEYGLASHYVEVFEAINLKDTPQGTLHWHTPREVYIRYAERERARHGQGIYAQMWLKAAALIMHQCDEIIVPDVRFMPEVKAAISLVGGGRMRLICVHRKDHDWTDDIGSYLYLAGRTIHFHNNSERGALIPFFMDALKRFEGVS